ncbi:MAG: hypothetical protein HUJ79_00995 [Firmicutes bacterium]|nr:hypothetical protein [Bacillota bacterium]
MAIKQLSVYIENKPGTLAGIVKDIADEDINIRAMSLADTTDFGVLRLITSDTAKLKDYFAEKAIVNITDVVAVKMDDKAGALGTILSYIGDAGISIDYMYAFTGAKALSAYVVLRVDDNEAVEKILRDKGVDTLDEARIEEIL